MRKRRLALINNNKKTIRSGRPIRPTAAPTLPLLLLQHHATTSRYNITLQHHATNIERPEQMDP